jgi:predicted amidohydrolase YtcJ
VRDGIIQRVGATEEIKALSGPRTAIVDLRGRTMVPGLIDSHCHLASSARSASRYVDVRVPPNRSIQDALRAIAERARITPPGEWIIAHGCQFGARKFAEGRYPTREELDDVTREHPVLVLDARHTYRLNTMGCDRLGLKRGVPWDEANGHAEFDDATGDPNGVLHEGFTVFPDRVVPYADVKHYMREVIGPLWVGRGFTSTCSYATANELRACGELAREGALPLRVTSHIHIGATRTSGIDAAVALGMVSGFGDEWMRIGGAKVFIDGAMMSLSSAMREPYLGKEDAEDRGILLVDRERCRELARRMHDHGIQISFHATGDKAQEMALDAIEHALTLNPRADHRHRIEHFGCDSGAADLRSRARQLGIVPNMTAGWLYTYGDFVVPHLGPERAKDFMALRSIHDAGLTPCNSSDQTGTDWLTLDPFFSMWCCVTRQTFEGRQLHPEQAITVKEALRMWTINAAWANFEDDIKGTIEPGKLADMTVCSADILTIPGHTLKDVRAVLTIIGGRIAFDAEA